ncbi:MAG: hypothetical protein IBJ10_09405 [Phycisphaerales bacterium]|nr:hypothetical protein [Phycisphaerales bacterium]
MAPTLMGQHMRPRSPHSGFDWSINPYAEQIPGTRMLRFGAPPTLNLAREPVTNLPYSEASPALRAGDRIGILKYNPLYHPRRFDVVVVKWPSSPRENYIKRLVGMPGEQLWLIDGDAFVRTPDSPDEAQRAWRILRKPARVQETLWWPLFSGEFTPLDESHDGRPWRAPWRPDKDLWTLERGRYRFAGGPYGELAWDSERWPITDWQPYNDYQQDGRSMTEFIPRFPISDLRVRASVLPETAESEVYFEISARGQHFLASFEPSRLRLMYYHRDPANAGRIRTTEVAVLNSRALPVGKVSEIAFCHVDQSLQLWIDGRLVLEGEYNWNPAERLRWSTNLPAAVVDALAAGDTADIRGNPLAEPSIYTGPGVKLICQAGPSTFWRVGLDRDVYYQPREYPPGTRLAGRPALATHPAAPATMGPDEFFLLGDNSANSADSRLVDAVDPWVQATVDSNLGLIHRKMMTGRAVVVFWPAAHPLRLGASRFSFIPDFGRMRFIW